MEIARAEQDGSLLFEGIARIYLVGLDGFEPSTSRLSERQVVSLSLTPHYPAPRLFPYLRLLKRGRLELAVHLSNKQVLFYHRKNKAMKRILWRRLLRSYRVLSGDGVAGTEEALQARRVGYEAGDA